MRIHLIVKFFAMCEARKVVVSLQELMILIIMVHSII